MCRAHTERQGMAAAVGELMGWWHVWGCGVPGCCWLCQDVAMSSRAIPGRVVPGSSRQEPAAFAPNKQPGGHWHIPGWPVATTRARVLPVYPHPTLGCSGDRCWPHPTVAPRARCGGASPVCPSNGGGGAWGPPQPPPLLSVHPKSWHRCSTLHGRGSFWGDASGSPMFCLTGGQPHGAVNARWGDSPTLGSWLHSRGRGQQAHHAML